MLTATIRLNKTIVTATIMFIVAITIDIYQATNTLIVVTNRYI